MKNLKYLLFSIGMLFMALSKVNAQGTCVYNETFNGKSITYVCDVGSNSVNCDLLVDTNFDENSYEDNSVTYVTYSNMKDGCLSKIYVSYSYDSNFIHSFNGVYATEVSCRNSNGECQALRVDKNRSSYKPSGNGGSNEESPSVGSSDEVADGESETDWNNICKRSNVQGIFTAIGWVFFILKIVVPIIIIIFGSIDLFKAIMASKDDEIKKATKILVMRAVAGIIIFFIPTLLEFVIGIFDNDDIYNNTFWDCTKCITNPNGEKCKSLGGE